MCNCMRGDKFEGGQHVEKGRQAEFSTREGIGARRSDHGRRFQLMPAIYYIIRPMKYEDIPQVAQIDREAFPGEWVFRSQAAYKQDLDNPSIRYMVACKEKHVPEPKGQALEKPPWFKRLFSYERRLNIQEYIVGFSGFWMMTGEAHIIAIGVRNDYRQLGVGEGLLILTIELAQISNANIVTLAVRP